MNPILSIVVPTKNRYYYLKFLVDYFHSIDSLKIELIIQDNSDIDSNHDFLSYLNKVNDNRIVYTYIEANLSVVENSDLAVANSKGEYITLIGDDDIFSKHLIEFVEQWKSESVDAILPVKGIYTWPDVNPRFYNDKLSGILRISHFTKQSKNNNIISELKKVVTRGGAEILNLPRVYHGVVKRTVLDNIFKDSGSYFPGPSPDMANAIALCKYVSSYITIDIPLIIAGHSIASAAGQGSQGEHYGEISKIKHLPNDTADNWTDKVPFYWSGNTIYAESVIQSLKRMKMDKYLSCFNYKYLYARCLVFDTNFRFVINDLIKKEIGINLNYGNFKILYYFILIWIKRIGFHVKNNLVLLLPDLFKKKNTIYNFQNIREVVAVVDELIENKCRL